MAKQHHLNIQTSNGVIQAPLRTVKYSDPALAVNTYEDGVVYGHLSSPAPVGCSVIAKVRGEDGKVWCLTDATYRWTKIWSCCVNVSNCSSNYSKNIYACIDRQVAKRGGMCVVMIPPSTHPILTSNYAVVTSSLFSCVRGSSDLGYAVGYFYQNACLQVTCDDGSVCTCWTAGPAVGGVDSGCCCIYAYTRGLCNPSYRRGYNYLAFAVNNCSNQYGHFGTIQFNQGTYYGKLKGGQYSNITGSIASSTAGVCVCSNLEVYMDYIAPGTLWARWNHGLSSGSNTLDIASIWCHYRDYGCGNIDCSVCGTTYTPHCEYATVIDNIVSTCDCYENQYCSQILFRLYGGYSALANGRFGYRGLKCNEICCDCPIVANPYSSQAVLDNYSYRVGEQTYCRYIPAWSSNTGDLSYGGVCLNVPCRWVYTNNNPIPTGGWRNGVASSDVPYQPDNSPCWIMEVWGWTT